MYIFAYFKYYEFLRCSNAYYFFFLDSVRLNVDKIKNSIPLDSDKFNYFQKHTNQFVMVMFCAREIIYKRVMFMYSKTNKNRCSREKNEVCSSSIYVYDQRLQI